MTSIVRYSTGASDVGPAKNFSWEYPIPQNRFWDDLSFVIGRNFLTCFSEDELVRLPLDPDSVQSRETKLELLLRLLEDRATEREAAAAAQHDKRNDGGEQRLTWYDVDYEGWSRQRLGVATLQEALGRFDDEEATVRELCLRRKDKTNLSYPHTLTVILLRKKQFAEAAENEAPVLEWLTGRLGADSPQALGAKRMIAQASWQLGRVEEARAMFSEVGRLIEGSGSGKYSVYQDEQRQITQDLVKKLEAGLTVDKS